MEGERKDQVQREEFVRVWNALNDLPADNLMSVCAHFFRQAARAYARELR